VHRLGRALTIGATAAVLLATSALGSATVRACIGQSCRAAGRECVRAFRESKHADLVACAANPPAKACKRRVRKLLRDAIRSCQAAVRECARCCREGGEPCPVAVCGNGLLEGGEACDRTAPGSCAHGCRQDCSCEPPPPAVCGNGTIESSEACDGPADTACPGRCLDDCTCAPAPVCGNGTIELDEQCEPGAEESSCPGRCLPDCTCALCGDGVIEPPVETCEPALDGCAETCSPYSCDCVSSTTDSCDEPHELTVLPAVDRQSNVTATHAPGDPDLSCVLPEDERSVWYAVTAPGTGRIRADAAGSTFDTILAVHTGACDALTEVACVDDADGTTTARVDFPVTAGERYLIEASAYFGTHPGELVLSVDFRPCGDGALDPGEDCEPSRPETCSAGICSPRCTCLAPPADECTDADVVTDLPVRVQQAAGLSTADPGDPALTCGTYLASATSTWFRFRPPIAGTIVVETIGSNYDTILGVLTGPCDALSLVDCNDDVTFGYQSRLELAATAGVDYTVLVVPYRNSVPDELDLTVRYADAP
jgi:hypothetical protein